MDQALIKKLRLKENQTFLVMNAPSYYLKKEVLAELNIQFDQEIKTGTYNVIQIFLTYKSQIAKSISELKHLLNANTTFWISYPKKNSGIESDLTMNHWEELKKFNLRPVASVAINQQWTALQIKSEEDVKPSAQSNSNIQQNNFSEYIDVANKTVSLPREMQELLFKQEESLQYFNSLAYSHKKEYVLYYLTAKQEKTKATRLNKIAEMLLSKKKNPNDK